VIEELGFIDTISADKADKSEKGKEFMLIGVSIPKIDPRAKEPSEIIFTTTQTFKEARIHIASQTSRILVSGQLRNVLFGSELASEGIWKQMDTLVRDPVIGQRVRVVVVNGKAAELLKMEYPQHPVFGNYLGKLLRNQAQANVVPEGYLYTFSRDYLDDGIDPVAPMIENHGKHVNIEGIALFKEDQYVAKIPLEKALFFAMLCDKMKQGEMSIDLSKGDERELLLLSAIRSNRKIKVKRTDHSAPLFEAHIQLDIMGTLREYIGPLNLENYGDQNQLEKEIGQYIEKEAESVIQQMQRSKADSIGIGQYVRNSLSYQEWKKLDWRSVYPQVKVHVTANVKVKDFGKISR
jgi:spore germination protein